MKIVFVPANESPYAELPEEEKASDREEADKMLAIVRRVREGDGQ